MRASWSQKKVDEKTSFFGAKKNLKKAPPCRVVVKCVINNNDNKMITK